MRVVLSLYLAMVAALGPWLCCCIANQLFAEQSTEQKSAPVAKCGCCTQETAPEEQPADEPMAPRSKCNCHQERPEAIVSSANPAGALSATDLIALDIPVSAGPGVLLIVEGATRCEHRSPDQSPGDILCKLHILRC